MASVVLYIEKRYCSRCGARIHKEDLLEPDGELCNRCVESDLRQFKFRERFKEAGYSGL